MDGLKEGSRLAIGSLPGSDPASAVQTQFRAFPEIPAWPQLPQKSAKEQMTRQGLSGLPGLSYPAPDQPIFTLSSPDLAEALETLKIENQEDRLGRAAFKPEEAAGFFAFLDQGPRFSDNALALKGQSIGPVTLGLTLQDEKGKPLLASKESMNVLAEYLLMHCRWQSQMLHKLKKPVILFLDEPLLSGGFQPENYGLKWKDIQGWFSKLLEPLQEEGIMTGIHCCGSGPWDWVFDTSVEFFHFDSYKYMNNVLEHPKGFKDFIHKGGMAVWGLVPTSMSRGVFSDPAELFHHWLDAFEVLVEKGFSQEELVGRSFFSTSCGLGNSSVSVAEEAIRCLGAVVSLWRANVSHK